MKGSGEQREQALGAVQMTNALKACQRNPAWPGGGLLLTAAS